MRLRTIGLAILFILLFFTALYLYIQVLLGSVVPPPPRTYSPAYNLTLGETGVVDNGEAGSRSLYIIYSLQARDVSEANISAKMYASEIPTDVYLLDYPCDDCRSLGDFSAVLEKELKRTGFIPLNSTLISLKFNQLERIDKKAIIIIPSGRLPGALFEGDSSANLNRLMERGSVVIYIGADFSQWKTRTGVVEDVPANALTPYGISYTRAATGAAVRPYTFEGGPYRLGGANVSILYSSIYLQSLSKGFFVVFPNSLDLGWNARGGGNGTAAARDVGRLISDISWQSPLADGNRTLKADADGKLNATDSLFISPTDRNGGYVRLSTSVFSPDGRSMREYRDLSISNPLTGRLFNTNFGVNGSILPLKFELYQNFTEPTVLALYLGAYEAGTLTNRQYLDSVSFNGTFRSEKRYTVNLTGGDYILRLTDVSERSYAQSLLHIPVVTAVLAGANWDDSVFTFSLLSDGRPVPDTEVILTVNGKAQPPVTTGADGRFTFRSPEKLGFGDHSFTLNATGRSLPLTATRTREVSFFERPLNQAIIVVTVLVLIVGLALRRSEPPKYFLDVPDFPPQQKERIPLSRFALINLMENINKEYRWKYMPLSLQEIKAGVRKRISYQGKPILISDYNLEKLLRRLEEGELSKSLGLYGLRAWQAQSGKDSRYLSIFRILRNFFISHAILFTEVGQRPDCDIMVNFRGESILIHIFEGDETARRALLSARKGKNFIIFESRDELRDFLRRLGPASTPLAVALKLELDARAITLTHIEALGPVIGLAAAA